MGQMEDGGPSATARRVAAYRLGFTRAAADYGDPAAEDTLAADVVDGLTVEASWMSEYLAARTSFFDRIVTGAIDRGVRQVVVGAAGYDGRSLRYAKPGVRWFEVDHPATQHDKLARLKRLGIAATGVQFVEADFTRDPVADRLRTAGLDADAPALFLLEGVAVYLEPAVLENVLDQFRQVAAPGSQLAVSVSTSRPAADGRRARFQSTVAALGEPARSFFGAGEAAALLARTGWQVADTGAKGDTPADRRRSAGLLAATAGPRSAAPAKTARSPKAANPQPSQPPQEGPRRRVSQGSLPATGPAARPAPAGRLAELATFGPYFAVDSHPPGSAACPPWRPLGELISVPGALAARIGEVRVRLAATAGCPADGVEFRVAASIAQLGLCARLLSPVLGAAAAGWTLSVDTAQARWVPTLGGPFRLSLPSEAQAKTGAGTAAPLALLAGLIEQVVQAVAAMAVSPQVLWGNVASAANGAATMIAAARPDLAAAAASTAATVLRYPALAGTYQGNPGAGFRRRNCCLIYRLSPPGPDRYCGDCVLGPGRGW